MATTKGGISVTGTKASGQATGFANREQAEKAANKYLGGTVYNIDTNDAAGGISKITWPRTASTGMEGNAGFGPNFADIFSTYLKYGPQLAQQQWMEQQRYTPLQNQLGFDQYAQFAPQYQRTNQALRSADREASMYDVLRSAPMMQKIREASENPTVTAMRNRLLGGINEELAMGSKLTPEQSRQTNEALRSAQFARGTAGGTGGSAREAVARALEGQSLLEQRQAKASAVLGQEYAASPNAFNAVLGAPTSAYSTTQAQATTKFPTINGMAAAQGVGNQALQSQQLAMQNAMYQNMLQYIPMLMGQLGKSPGSGSGGAGMFETLGNAYPIPGGGLMGGVADNLTGGLF